MRSYVWCHKITEKKLPETYTFQNPGFVSSLERVIWYAKWCCYCYENSNRSNTIGSDCFSQGKQHKQCVFCKNWNTPWIFCYVTGQSEDSMERDSLAHLGFSYGLCYKFRKLRLKLLVWGLTNLTEVALSRHGARCDSSEANGIDSTEAQRKFLWYQMEVLVLRSAQDQTSPQEKQAEGHIMLFSFKMLLGKQKWLQGWVVNWTQLLNWSIYALWVDNLATVIF